MSRLHTMFISSDPGLAALAVAAGVDEIFVDLEVMGKADRQGHLDSWKSRARADDVSRVREVIPDGRLLVRINPMHEGTKAEIDDAIARGADAIMLPMWSDWQTLARVREMIADRAALVPLAETAGAIDAMEDVATNVAPDRMHIGLNDLSLDLGQSFMFQPLAEGRIDEAAAALRAADIPFGIGGVARTGAGAVPAEVILGEHVRLGSTWAILSRAFHDRALTVEDLSPDFDFADALASLQNAYKGHLTGTAEALQRNRADFQARVRAVVEGK